MEYFALTMFCLSILTITNLSGKMMSVISLFVRVPLKAKVPSKSPVIQWPPRHACLHKEDTVTFKSISGFLDALASLKPHWVSEYVSIFQITE